jgi:putative membrane protein
MKAVPAFAFALSALLVSAPAHATADGDFLTDAMKGDSTEVSMGKLAEKRGASAQTRAYGHMLVVDHGAHRKKVAALARSMGVAPTMELSDDGMKARTMLMGMHGTEFDAAFKQHMIEDHTQDIAKYETEASSAQSPRVRMLAKTTLPTLHKHLDHANAL